MKEVALASEPAEVPRTPPGLRGRVNVQGTIVTLLDTHGLSSLTMRRLGAELDIQPSAIYHHFPSKQALLAAVADEILARGARPRTASSHGAM